MNSIVMITGASGGLGRVCAAHMADKGWRVASVTRDMAALSDSGDAMGEIIEADVSTPEGANLAMNECRERLGSIPSGLINCAGSILVTPLHLTKEAQYRDCLRSNIDSAFFALSAFVSALVKAKQPGAAVLISTVAARIGIANHEAVAAAKGAVEGLVRSAAATYSGKGVRINAIAPGLMKGPSTQRFFSSEAMEQQMAAQYPLGRYGHLEDAADAAAWLISDASKWITGQILSVDGGFTAVRPMIRK